MPRKATNWRAEYIEAKKIGELHKQANDALHLEMEKQIKNYDKMIVEAKRLREMLYEQRGVIGFLEAKIEKLVESKNVHNA